MLTTAKYYRMKNKPLKIILALIILAALVLFGFSCSPYKKAGCPTVNKKYFYQDIPGGKDNGVPHGFHKP